ncbi:hypothetical protein LS684_21160 (plasmid) [Cytobacillus spongiae]|uniref:hypothetical protein n=1 Tax=Cytobacillus spongiae TaxID=2901381 RepID=UPI001F3E1910|nr:hypothetical protein [Cytobacillus spongiae]UII58134.1 hypothetical protein LS684_21160 [Cytobacillus spongiae]
MLSKYRDDGLDKKMEWSSARESALEKGLEGSMKEIDEDNKLGLYYISSHWMENPKYICKAKGLKGDVVIGWKGIHY